MWLMSELSSIFNSQYSIAVRKVAMAQYGLNRAMILKCARLRNRNPGQVWLKKLDAATIRSFMESSSESSSGSRSSGSYSSGCSCTSSSSEDDEVTIVRIEDDCSVISISDVELDGEGMVVLSSGEEQEEMELKGGGG